MAYSASGLRSLYLREGPLVRNLIGHDVLVLLAEDEVAPLDMQGLPTALVAMHSFTPVFMGVARPWRVWTDEVKA